MSVFGIPECQQLAEQVKRHPTICMGCGVARLWDTMMIGHCKPISPTQVHAPLAYAVCPPCFEDPDRLEMAKRVAETYSRAAGEEGLDT